MNTNDPPLIPRRLLFGNPDRSSVTISPDGKRLMWLAPLDGVLNIWLAPREDLAAAKPITQDSGRGIHFCSWTHNPDYVLALQDRDGDENWHLYAVDPARGKTRDLTPFDGVMARYMARSAKYPDEIVVGLNHRNPQWHDLYRINIDSGARELLLEHERFVDFVFDNDLQLRFALEMTADGGMAYHQMIDGEWQLWQRVPLEDVATTGIVGFDKANEILYLRESRDRDTAALAAINLSTGEKAILAADPKADISGGLRHPEDKHLQAAAFVYARRRWQILDPSIDADLAYLGKLADGDFNVTSRSRDDLFWVVAYVVADGPTRFYLYDRKNRTAIFLFTSKKDLENLFLAKMHPVIIEARDGLVLVGYYSLPPGSDSKNDAIPDQPLPLVFTPHGGPWMRDHWQFHPWHQWLTNRGYAVLTVNFRASTGFGKAFVNAGNLEWGGKIIDDQQDAIRWAIDAGIADPERLAIVGGSFGGYSVLAGLTFSPELFACGVDLVGIANLITWLESIPAYWKPMAGQLATRVGDPGSVEGRRLLQKHSPINYADRICRPLLVGQGANDPRVKQAESDQIVQAMKGNSIPVTYALYPDEGHGFVRPQNNQSFYAMAEAFLAQHLGGRYEPIGNDFEGSSAEILNGIEYIPGLQEALDAIDSE